MGYPLTGLLTDMSGQFHPEIIVASLGFRDQFEHYLLPSQETEKLAFASGLIVLDTNVLLDVYRFASNSRAELLSVVDQLKDRIWIPHQVGEEFYRNRLDVMADLRAGYATLKTHVSKAKTELVSTLSERINQLDNRVLLRGEKDDLIQHLETALDPMFRAVDALEGSHGIAGNFADDPTLTKLEDLLNGRIGNPFTREEFESHVKEANRRIAAKEPPGYLDAAKKGDHAYGDYFVWMQSLAQAKKLKVPVLLIVTGDTKEDWYRHVHRKWISARPELCREAYETAGCRLIMMDAARFLAKAPSYTQVQVSAETIQEAEEFPRTRQATQPTLDLMADALNLVVEETRLNAASEAIEQRIADMERDLREIHRLLTESAEQSEEEIARLREGYSRATAELAELTYQKRRLAESQESMKGTREALQKRYAAEGDRNLLRRWLTVRLPIPDDDRHE